MFYLRDAYNLAVNCLMTSGNEILSSSVFIMSPVSSYRARSTPCKSMIRKMLSSSRKYRDVINTSEILTLIVLIQLYWIFI